MKDKESFEQRYYNQLVGKKIKEVQLNVSGIGSTPVLVFTDGTFAQVSCDPGGNGPGHIFICDSAGNDMFPPEKK